MEEVIRELLAQVEPLRSGTHTEKSKAYAVCTPLIGELGGMHRLPLPVRELKALTHEASWHLRSLAGLAGPAGVQSDEQHAAWARESLREIARCAQLQLDPIA